jgi:pimeloyl-ACP methyl ester carboxylesterase
MNDNLDPVAEFVTIAGERYCYRKAGQGPPMLLIHGMGETSKVFWRELIAHFKERYTLIAVDIRGYGDSEKPARGYRLSDHARIIAGGIDQLKLDRPIVVGHSLGGVIAAKFAILFPEQLSKLVLYDSPIGGRFSPNVSVIARMPPRGVLLMSLLYVPFVGKFFFERRSPQMVQLVLSSLRLFRDPADYTDEVIREGMRHSYEALTQGAWHAIGFQNLFNDLDSITVPTLIIHGEYDALAPRYWADQVHRRIANSQLSIIPDSAHQPLNEQPELFNQALERFLASSS